MVSDLIKAKLIGVSEGDHCVGPDAKASRMIEMGIPLPRKLANFILMLFVAQSHTPCNRCVRFATTVASGHATLSLKQMDANRSARPACR